MLDIRGMLLGLDDRHSGYRILTKHTESTLDKI